MADAGLQFRIDEVRRRLPLAGEVTRDGSKLSGSAGAKARRCVCPFHQGKSSSFVVYPGEQQAHCFGCGWHGDVIGFVRDKRGLSFIDALKECEALAGLSSSGAATEGSGTVQRERSPAASRPRDRVFIDPLDMARVLWRRAGRDHAAVRRYFMGRGVPAAVLTDARLADFRFLGDCPLGAWELRRERDRARWPSDALVAPAIVAMVRRPQLLNSLGGETLEFVPVGLHVTWLNPSGTGTMLRRKPWAKPDDREPHFAKRKMLGPVGHGAVMLGTWRADAPLFVGEGNETVLSGMALAGAPDEAVGVATLSLDNLQGGPLRWKNGALPLHAIAPDPDKPCFTIPGQRGPVTGLVDSDMSPLLGQIDRATGKPLGMAVVERKGGPLMHRAIDGAERARICGELFVKGWRAAGVADARALRAPLGMDFNDVVQSQQVAA